MTVLSRARGPARPVPPAEPPLAGRRQAGRTVRQPPIDVVDQWGEHSFPASDPPANW